MIALRPARKERLDEIAKATNRSEEEIVEEAISSYPDEAAPQGSEHDAQLAALRQELAPALEAIERGEGVPFDAATLKAEGRRRMASRSEAG